MRIALFFALGLLHAAQAAESLSWQACMDEAAGNNAELRAARENLLSSEYSALGARSGFYPQITANLGYDHSNSTGNALSGTTYNATVSATQNLFSGYQDQARVNQATANTRASAAKLQSVKATISFNLKSAYANLLFAQASLKLQQDIIRRREENLHLVELRFESGRENKGSVLLNEAYLSQARYDELQARNDIRVAQAQMAKVLGRDKDTDMLLSEEIPTQPPPASPDLEKLALATPDHAQSVAQEAAAKAGVEVARGTFYPTINLTGTLGTQDSDWFPQNSRWSVGLNLSYPLYSGEKDTYAVKSAVANLSSAAETRMDADRTTLANLRQKHAAYLEAVEKVRVDESFLKAAEIRAEIGRNRYNNGLISFEDWDIVENDLIARQKSVLQSRRDRVTAEAAFEQAQGTGAIP